MAACDQGYLCDVCGEEVKSIRDSDLYLRYVTGQISARDLSGTPERHLKCNPVTAQFIRADGFPETVAEGPFSRNELDEAFVTDQTALMTRGWIRLQELAEVAQTIRISEYPLPEFRNKQPSVG